MSPNEPEMLEDLLRANLQAQRDELRQLLESVSDHWGYEDPIYRFYHQSFKVYRLAESTRRIVIALQRLLPDQPLNPWFLQIIRKGSADAQRVGRIPLSVQSALATRAKERWTLITSREAAKVNSRGRKPTVGISRGF